MSYTDTHVLIIIILFESLAPEDTGHTFVKENLPRSQSNPSIDAMSERNLETREEINSELLEPCKFLFFALVFNHL